MNTPPSAPGAETADDSAVRIGALVPLTRPGWVEAGRHLLAGLELAVGDVNDAGGILGRPVELAVRDTAADPETAAAAVDELARLGVAALAGEYHSVVARAAAARADALGLPFLCSSAGAPRGRRRHRHRARAVRARPRRGVRRGRRQWRDRAPGAGRVPGAGRGDRRVRPPRPAAGRHHDRRPGRAA